MSMEVNEGMTNLLSHMKEDYHKWSMMTRTVHQNVDDFNRDIAIREEMEAEYDNGLHYEEHTKYIKVMSSSRGGGCSVKCFVVNTENDKKFRFGDKVTIIAGGGIQHIGHVAEYINTGADHISIGSVCFNPIKTWKLLRALR